MVRIMRLALIRVRHRVVELVALVNSDHQARRDRREEMDDREHLDDLEIRARLVETERFYRRHPHDHRVKRVRRDRLDPLARLVQRVCPARKVMLEIPVETVPLVRQDLLDNRDHPVLRAYPAIKVRPVMRARS